MKQKTKAMMPEIYTIERAGLEFAGPYNETAVAAIIGSVPRGYRDFLTVTEWPGDPLDPDEPGVEVAGDHWLDTFLSFDGLPVSDLTRVYSEGTRVFIGERFKVPKRQKRIAVIDAVYPEFGRDYAILRGITKRGISRARSQVTYWQLNQLWLLEWLGQYLRYIPKTDPSGLIHAGIDWRADILLSGQTTNKR